MKEPQFYDPAERAREKQRARDKDDADLRSGKVTRDELAARNGFFSSVAISQGRIKFPGSFDG